MSILVTKDALDSICAWKDAEFADFKLAALREQHNWFNQRIDYQAILTRRARMKVEASCYWAKEELEARHGTITDHERKLVLDALDFLIHGRLLK